MLEWADDLKISGTELFLDSRRARSLCFVSHAHSDHLGEHATAIATPATAALAERRIELGSVRALAYGADLCDACGGDDAAMRVRLLPAGHVLGSAMLHVTRAGGTLLYTGDFKLRHSLTVEPAAPEPADVLVMECTYGQPMFRFPPWRTVADELVERATTALRDGRQPIVMGYSLGKAQEITRVLTDAGLPVTLHGAPWHVHQTYEQLGVSLGAVRRYALADFHGPRALDLQERGVLVAPPSAARSAFVTRFTDPLRIMMTGWSLLPGAKYRYGVDHVLPLSDHADYDELLELVGRVRPKRVFTHHGFRSEFAEVLRRRGYDATPAEPEKQLSLFGP